MPAGHIRRETHCQSKRLYQHPYDFNWNQKNVNRPRHAMRNDILPVIDKSVRF
jgi:hypothetical protein